MSSSSSTMTEGGKASELVKINRHTRVDGDEDREHEEMQATSRIERKLQIPYGLALACYFLPFFWLLNLFSLSPPDSLLSPFDRVSDPIPAKSESASTGKLQNYKMGRGVSSGGGQSSLGYLFGGGEAPKSVTDNAAPVEKPAPPPTINKEIPAGIQSSQAKNYYRADGQNGNFITERPSTKVHAAPGGGSSLGYLFGNGGN
ncbi:protein SPIRAL1-like 3 [Canna indica]|uniref:Protein SPIRAL1-like 3 n=1 Tax=Canna indica TaxID=4628 RepID=A0AAQ3JY11_9LILI|nr:protein SPIRAL1-like 3 [Canna indica]